MLTINLTNEAETLAFGAKLATLTPNKCTIFLQGELGAGKTTLVRGFLHSLGHQGKVKSPTYTLVETYNLDNRNIMHFDLYRLHNPEELNYIGIRDYFTTAAILLIEWPEKGNGYLPAADLILHLQPQLTGRQLSITANSLVGEEVIVSLRRVGKGA